MKPNSRDFCDVVRSAVEACGGYKKVAGKLWSHLGSDSGAARLRAALNADHAQKLDLDELLMIGKFAREAGDHSIMEFLACEWEYSVRPLPPDEAKRQARRLRRKAILQELEQLDKEDE